MPLTTQQAIAEISGGSNEDGTYSRNMPAVHIDEGRIFVHIGPNELTVLATSRGPVGARVFKTVDAAVKECFALCAKAHLQGFQRIEVCQHIDARSRQGN